MRAVTATSAGANYSLPPGWVWADLSLSGLSFVERVILLSSRNAQGDTSAIAAGVLELQPVVDLDLFTSGASVDAPPELRSIESAGINTIRLVGSGTLTVWGVAVQTGCG